MKNLQKYASGMAPQNLSFAMESLHYLACFLACEDILWRHHTEYQIASFVIQYLHYNRDSGVYKIITRSIRSQLSKYVPKNEKDALISKSLCIASVTKMAAHRGVKLFKIHDC